MIAEVGFTMLVAHYVGDYWVQTDAQAAQKEHSALACVLHVWTYTATQALFLWLLTLATEWEPQTWPFLAGLALTALTHYIADRRAPLRWLAERLGKGGFVQRGGLPLLDQAWHIGWLFPAALLIGS